MRTPHWLATFGARPTGARQARIDRSPNFRDGVFQNPVETRKAVAGTFLRSLVRQVTGHEVREPPGPLPIRAVTRASFATPPESGLRATWLGHSTVLLEIDGVRVLTDPVWAERVSPFSFAGPRRFHPPPLPLGELPPLDVVLLSHDHYDHLDMATVRALAADPIHAAARFVMPLGVGAHLERWGIQAARITELDLGESVTLSGAEPLTLTATPARHFSGRAIRDAFGRGNTTLWASWVLAGPRHRVFFSGDTGPFDGLADIGVRHGPFDLGLVKMGAYDELWPDIHLNPEGAVAAQQMVRARVLLPIHWGTFNLAFHAWDEPAERVVHAAEDAGVVLVMPRPGESIEPAMPPAVDAWWQSVVKTR